MMSEGNRLDRRGFLKGLLTRVRVRGFGVLTCKRRGLLKDKQKSEVTRSGNDER